MTRPRYFRQYGSFPLVIVFRTNERFWSAQIQMATAVVCVLLFAAGLLLQLRNPRHFMWSDACLMAMAILVVVGQQIYYSRLERNYFQLYRDQLREDKEDIAFLKRNHFG